MGQGISVRGMYRDVLKGPDNVVIFESHWHANTIVKNCRVLIAGFMKNDSPGGIRHLAVGRGKDEWDTDPPGSPDPDGTTALETPFSPPVTLDPVPGRGHVEISYLDDQDKPVVSGVTNRLLVKATLEPGYPAPVQFNAYPLREFGLFGTFDGADYMINCVRHPVIYKDVSATLVREVKLYF